MKVLMENDIQKNLFRMRYELVMHMRNMFVRMILKMVLLYPLLVLLD